MPCYVQFVVCLDESLSSWMTATVVKRKIKSRRRGWVGHVDEKLRRSSGQI
jgi:hypothetical protein